MESSSHSVRLTRSDARVIARACSTFTTVPFTSEKPKFKSDITALLDTTNESIHQIRGKLSDPDDDVLLSLSPDEIKQLCIVIESILTEYANVEMELRLFVAPRSEILSCLQNLKVIAPNETEDAFLDASE